MAKAWRETFRNLTGITRRHNRALVLLEAILAEAMKFIDRYGKSTDVFANIGIARVDVTTAIYKLRKMDKPSATVGGKRVEPLVQAIYSDLEKVRVDIYNPGKGEYHLEEDLSHLQASCRDLAAALAETEAAGD